MVAKIRRVVTGHNNGKATVMFDGEASNVVCVPDWDGFAVTELWVTEDMPVDNSGFGADQGSKPMRLDPEQNGTVFRIAEVPPESAGSIKPEVLFETMGLDKTPEEGQSSRHFTMHRTDSIDYAIVMKGEIWLILDEEEILVREGDCIVQRGTSHAWVNRGDAPCLLAFVMIDAKPLQTKPIVQQGTEHG